ncbi:hypothetical protein [Desulfobulbus alkaliphilus]|uniref:hypothetical protein n=1 Tax=Desulfobulbus alkaliphilus TaxID=869814 RepID=UPI001966A4F4|nr:hypothetical protein [Desulfobulbus alkaliphilus]MBM9536277.1 hypothetical protein [Desulfobulbus alkaliphilus]
MTKVRFFPLLLFFALSYSLANFVPMPWSDSVVHAQSQAEYLREANNLIRSAERSFHGGKLEEARMELDKANQALEAAAAEGDSPQLSSARTRYDRLSGNVDRRLEDAVSASVSTAPTPTPQTARFPASRDLRELNREMERTRSNLNDHRWWDLSPSIRETRLQGASESVDTYRERLDAIIASVDPAFHDSPEIRESQAILADISPLIQQRSTETEPVEESSPAATEALFLAEKIQELHHAFNARFQGVHGSSMIEGTTPEDQLEQGRKAVAQLETLEQDVLPLLQPVMGNVVDTLGETPAAINNALHDLGVKTDFDVGSRFDDLHRGLVNVEKSRRASSQDLARQAEFTMMGIEGLAEEIRLERLQGAREFLLLAQAFDTADQDVNRLLGQVDTLYAEMSVRIEKEIDARAWAGNMADFPGPGTVAELSQAALDFIRQHPNWNPPGRGTKILATSVQGPWDVGTRDLFGRVLQWRLPLHVAITNSEMKKDNIARVYELSILTAEGTPARVEKKPPFTEYWVGNSWNMRIENVPAQQ